MVKTKKITRHPLCDSWQQQLAECGPLPPAVSLPTPANRHPWWKDEVAKRPNATEWEKLDLECEFLDDDNIAPLDLRELQALPPTTRVANLHSLRDVLTEEHLEWLPRDVEFVRIYSAEKLRDLSRLKMYEKLRFVQVYNTWSLRQEGVLSLKEAAPQCKICCYCCYNVYVGPFEV